MNRGDKEQGKQTPTRIGWSPVLCLAAILAAPFAIAAAPPGEAIVAYVVDGDTVRLTSGERVRIAGIDAPETRPDNAKCKAEIALGKDARARAKTLLEGRRVTVVRVGRSYNRTVAKLSVAGRDVATTLVASGAARQWPRGSPRPNWCPVRNR